MENHDFFEQTAVIVFAKTLNIPAKTRIAQSLGQDSAQRIYRELLDATTDALVNIPYHVAFTGSDNPDELSDYFSSAISFFQQTGGDLGERMRNACLHCKGMGYSFFIVIGCDCPERDSQEIGYAAQCLTKGADVVLGPVEDGGYHLAGVNESGLVIFDAKQWSMPGLIDETCEIIKKHALKCVMLQTRSDIDTIDDYRIWKDRVG